MKEPKGSDGLENHYKMLVEGELDLAIYFLSPEGIIQTWNKAAEKLKGYKPEDVVGQHLSKFYTKEDRDLNMVERELEVAKTQGRYEGGGWRIRKDGSRFWADVIISALRDQKGNLIGFVKVSRDGTDRLEKERLIEKQKQELLELSTPVIHLWDGILALPIVGTLDAARSRVVMDKLLQEIVVSACKIAILDISGVAGVDTVVAQSLMKTVDAARLLGAQCIISGIRPEIAQTIVHLGIDLGRVRTKSTMARALQEALASQEMEVTRIGKGS